MFADLIEQAIKSGFRLPSLPAPLAAPPLQARAAAQHIPDNLLQHPGFYYYMAGLCAAKRRECFRRALQDLSNEAAEIGVRLFSCLSNNEKRLNISIFY